MNMTRAERTELQQVVRLRFRVLREEVKERKAELMATLETQVTEHFRDADKTWEDACYEIQQVVLTCNRGVNDVLYKYGYSTKDGSEREYVRPPSFQDPSEKMRYRFRVEAVARIEQQVKAALVNLDRMEADLRERLTVGVLESDAAKAFFAQIPTVGELVPAARLEEIAAAVHATDDDDN